MKQWSCLFLLFAALIGVGVGPTSRIFAQEDERNCFDCNKTGYKPCTDPTCKRTVCPTYKGEHKCMKVYELPCCHGFRKVPCKICGHLRSQAEWNAEMEDRNAWVQEMNTLDKNLRIDLEHIQTEHFRLHYGIEKLKVGDQVLDRNQGAHLYAQRLEAMLADFITWFGEPLKYPRTGWWEVFVMKNPMDSQKARATINSGNAMATMYGVDTSRYIIGFKDEAVGTDEELHANLYHHVSQIILQMGDIPAKRKFPGWISEGFAHFIEKQRFKLIRNWCVGEVVSATDPWRKATEYETKVYGMVSKSKEPQFATFADRDSNELSGPLHGLSFAFVDFLLKEHKDKAGDLMRTIVSGSNTAEAFQKVMGWSLAKVHEEWRKFVEKNYAPK